MVSKQKNDWLVNISGKPNEFLGKYLVHDDLSVLFSTPSITAANQWMIDHSTEHSNLSCFYLSKNFFSKNIRSIRLNNP